MNQKLRQISKKVEDIFSIPDDSDEWWLSPTVAAVASVLGELGPTDRVTLDFHGMYLDDADFGSADLRLARFTGAHLEKVSFIHANLSHAALSSTWMLGADLDMTNLERADLRDARGLTQEQLNKAFGDTAIRLPSPFTIPTRHERTRGRPTRDGSGENS